MERKHGVKIGYGLPLGGGHSGKIWIGVCHRAAEPLPLPEKKFAPLPEFLSHKPTHIIKSARKIRPLRGKKFKTAPLPDMKPTKRRSTPLSRAPPLNM